MIHMLCPRWNLLFCLLTVLLLTGVSVSSQHYYFRHYEVKDGLSDNSIERSIQDKDGFMWFSTKDGLTRFDGSRFKVFHTGNGAQLARDYMSPLAVDRKGVLWVGAEKGLYYFDKEHEKLVLAVNSPREVYRMMVDSSDRLWVIAGGLVYTREPSQEIFYPFMPGAFAAPTDMCQGADGAMWFTTIDGSLCTLNRQTNKIEQYDLFRHSPRTHIRTATRVVMGRDGDVYVGTISQGLKRFNINTRDYTDVITRYDDGGSIFVIDILPVSDEEIWLGTERGILMINEHTGWKYNAVRRYLDPYSLSDNAVYTLCKDKEGGIWAGTFFGGVNYYPNRQMVFDKFYPDYSPNSIGGNAVREICKDSLGFLWIGMEDAGLTRLDPRTGAVKRFMPGNAPGDISHSNIHGLLIAGNDLWIGTHFHGVDVMDVRTGKVRKHYSAGKGPGALNNEFVLTFLHTRNGDIYLGSHDGLVKYLPLKDQFAVIAVDRTPHQFVVSSLLEDSKGYIWIGTYFDGLYRLNPQTGEVVKINTGNNTNAYTINVSALHEDGSGYIWAASAGYGLWRVSLDTRSVQWYTVADGLPSNTCYKVLEDDNRHLWITTAKGLVNMDPRTGKMSIYTQEDGLLNDQFNFNSGYKDQDGRLYFGSTRGMISFIPAAVRHRTFEPPLFITGLQINNKDVAPGADSGIEKALPFTKELVLRYDQSSINLDFAAVSFTIPEKIRYSYKMEGSDKDWTQLPRNRRVYFTDLKPGRYVFHVRASSGDFNGVRETSLVIRIKPPVWKTTAAYLLYGLLIVSLAYYLIRSYLQVQQAKKEKELIDAKMEFFTNIAHEIRTPLTLIKGPIEMLQEIGGDQPQIKKQLDTVERNTDRLIRLVSQVLDFRSTEMKGFRLNFEQVNVSQLLKETFESFRQQGARNPISWELELPGDDVCIMADSEALYKIFSNLIGNAGKYTATFVKVRLLPPQENEAVVSIEISNDGLLIPVDMREKIFEPFVRLKET
ncbi:MAG TPA: two-component regulator propeller domain-containing protein, partial [Chitinophaga sp.]|uniref:ligand-binding sensor domain-containing protein n=1 Tax=Chitinophaga sp. TaxID=1869181 RepID=UPI002B7CD80B